MVQEDERKLDAMSKRHTELTMVNNNSKLLNEMLDHYDKASCGAPELDLLKELFQSCEKMQPKLFRMAAESTDETETGAEEEENDGEGIMDILNASDELTRVIDRYKMVIQQGKPDITRKIVKQSSETLLDLELALENQTKQRTNSFALLDEDMLGLGLDNVSPETQSKMAMSTDHDKTPELIKGEPQTETKDSASAIRDAAKPSIDDLLLEGSPISSTPVLATSSIASHIPKQTSPFISNGDQDNAFRSEKTSRQRGLEELDLLGEVAIKSHLPTKNEKSPQFAKKNAKMSMNELKQRKMEKEMKSSVSKDQITSQVPLLEQSQQVSTSRVSGPLLHSSHNSDNAILSDLAEISSDYNGRTTAAHASTLSSSNCDRTNQISNKAESQENGKETIVGLDTPKEQTVPSSDSKGNCEIEH